MRLDYQNKIEFNFILRVTVSHYEPRKSSNSQSGASCPSVMK